MGRARLFVFIQFHFCSIGKVKITRCNDDITLIDGCLFLLATRNSKGIDIRVQYTHNHH